MTTIGLDFVVIKDNRGCQSGFFWSDVQQIIGVYDDHQVIGTHKEVDESVKVKFRNDHKGTYTLIFVMPVKEFLEQVEKQLGAGIPNPSYITPGQVTIEPLSNPYPDGPADQIVTS